MPDKRREALRALSRRYPLPEHTGRVFESLEKDKADREVAIIAGALVEACLERAIISSLELTDQSMIGQLFKNRGPLTDFQNKILMAECLKLGVTHIYPDLRLIKDVRNAFAHGIDEITFSTKEVADLFAESDSIKLILLEYNNGLEKVLAEYPDPPLSKENMKLSNKSQFLMVSKISCSMLGFTTDATE